MNFRSIDSGVLAANVALQTVPLRHDWRLIGASVVLVSSAVVGNRQVILQLRDGSDVEVARFAAEATQAASLTQRYAFAPGLPSDSAAIAEMVRAPMAGLVLPAGYDLRALDVADIDGAGDTIRLILTVEQERSSK